MPYRAFPMVYVNKKPGPAGDAIVNVLHKTLCERFSVVSFSRYQTISLRTKRGRILTKSAQRLRPMQLAQNRAIFSYENLGTTVEAVSAVLEPDDLRNHLFIFIITDYRLHNAEDAVFAELYRDTAVFRGADFISVILKDEIPELTNGYTTHRTNSNDTEHTNISDMEHMNISDMEHTNGNATEHTNNGHATEHTYHSGTESGLDGEAAEHMSAPIEPAELAGTQPDTPLYRFSIPHEIEVTIDRRDLRGVGTAIAQYVEELFDEGAQDRILDFRHLLLV
ncbi:MAG: hypothetical protein LQ348_002928 [Seirophora lacunosa]|nr:MAG: hypothetical protein LQ348_002928 [Seirophora lacunosa]